MSRYPGPPTWILALRLCVCSGGSQPISSCSPTTASRSAFCSFSRKLGFGFDEVRILISLGDGIDIDLVAAHLARQRREIFGGGHHVQFAGGMRDADAAVIASTASA